MHAVRSLAKQIEELFAEIDASVEQYAEQSGLRCPAGCGACCASPDVAVTVLDMLPMALSIIVEGEAESFMASGARCPLFQDFGGGQGRCRRYEKRPALCRLFGFAAAPDKYGRAKLVLCRVQKQRGVVINEELRPPVFADFSRRLAALAPEYDTKLIPIGEALRVALEKVMLLETLAEKENSRESPVTGSFAGVRGGELSGGE